MADGKSLLRKSGVGGGGQILILTLSSRFATQAAIYRSLRTALWAQNRNKNLKKGLLIFKVREVRGCVIPSRPKLLQKKSLQRKCFGAINFVKNYKRITLQSKFLGLFSCKQGQTSGSNITKKMFWWNFFVIITKIITKIIVPRNYFVIISARMVVSQRRQDDNKNKIRLFEGVGMGAERQIVQNAVFFSLGKHHDNTFLNVQK